MHGCETKNSPTVTDTAAARLVILLLSHKRPYVGLSVGTSSPESEDAVYSILEISVKLTKLGAQVR